MYNQEGTHVLAPSQDCAATSDNMLQVNGSFNVISQNANPIPIGDTKLLMHQNQFTWEDKY